MLVFGVVLGYMICVAVRLQCMPCILKAVSLEAEFRVGNCDRPGSIPVSECKFISATLGLVG